MNLPEFTDPFMERPLQRRSAFAQAQDLDVDPGQHSPLERQLGAAILSLLLNPDDFGPPAYINLFLPRGAAESMEDFPPLFPGLHGVINVTSGCWLGDYQADFLFCVKAPGRTVEAWGALECDGHQFHEKTSEQVANDRKRDREMQAIGIAVLRFPGWQINGDAKGCAREAINILLKISQSKSSEAA